MEELFALADKIEARYKKAKEHVDKLTQSILAKAFRGELVPQDPNDEPASELLKRIIERTGTEDIKNKRRKGRKKRGHMPDTTRFCYVDEAGDTALFNTRGRIIIGDDGCSKFFILGLLEVSDPLPLRTDLASLKDSLVNDPYFKNVPSMQPQAGKTALFFHAKDDVPEVRREVFEALSRHNLHFLAIVRDKAKLLEYVRQRNEVDQRYRYNGNEIYDFLVRQLFHDRLHQHGSYDICFAERGKSDRTGALCSALETARDRFCQKWGVTNNAVMKVTLCQSKTDRVSKQPTTSCGLCRGSTKGAKTDTLSILWPQFKLVRDLDDTRNHTYGEYYTQKSPLTLAGKNHIPGI